MAAVLAMTRMEERARMLKRYMVLKGDVLGLVEDRYMYRQREKQTRDERYTTNTQGKDDKMG
jgi:hypothetical protein